MPSRTAIVTSAVGGFFLGVLFSAGTWPGTDSTPSSAMAASQQPTGDLLPSHDAPVDSAERNTPVVQVAARAAPAVVSITTEVPNQSPFRMFYNLPDTTSSQGSGCIIRSDGVVLTNAHVVDGAMRITATLSDGTSYEATVLGLDEQLDLAVLRLEGANDLPSIPLGTSSDLLLGEPVIVIGNPFGLGHTVTTGVISSASRTLEVADRVYQDYIQTDAGINPGNSGGPLLNIHGQLIGVTSAIRKDAENIGFAIPVDRAAKVARDLLRYGSVQAPWLGVSVKDIGGPRYRGTAIAEGAVAVSSVLEPGSQGPFLHSGDIILKVNGKPVHSRDDLNLRMATSQPGDEIRLEGLREGELFKVDVTALAAAPDMGRQLLQSSLGVTVTPIDARTARSYGLRTKSGLLVATSKPTGTFAMAGLRAGDVILAVNGTAVKTEEDLRTSLLKARTSHRDSVLLTVQRGPYRGHVDVDL